MFHNAKKAAIFAILLLALAGIVSARMFESFEVNVPPPGWIKTNLLCGSGWYQLPSGCMPMPGWGNGTSSVPPVAGAGSHDAYCSWTTGGGAGEGYHNDQWLISPRLTGLTSTSTVSYWTRFMFTNFPDTLYVCISTNTAKPSDFTFVIQTNIWTRGGQIGQFGPWTNTVVSLGSLGIPAGTPIYIAFHEYEWDNTHNGCAMELDVVSSDLTPPPEARFDKTQLAFSTVYSSNPASQAVTLANVGSGDNVFFSNMLSYSQSPSGWASLSVSTGHLSFGESQVITVPVNVAGMSTGVYSAILSATVPGASSSPLTLPITLTIAKAPQTISLPSIPSQYTTNRIQLAGTAGSGLPVNYAIANGPAILSDGTNLSFSGTGSVTLLAMQAGNANWNAAPILTNTFTVSKSAAELTLGSLVQTYNGSARPATALTVPEGLVVQLTYDGSALAPTDVGSYAVTGTVVDSIYQGSVTGLLNVVKAPQSIAFLAPGVQRSTNTVCLSATADSGLPVSFFMLSGPGTLSGGTNLSFSGLGSVQLAALQAGDGNWEAAPTITQTIEVIASPAVVTLQSLRQTYSGTARPIDFQTSPTGLAVTVTYDGSLTPPISAGNYAVTGLVHDTLYEGLAEGVLIVAKADQSIAFPALSTTVWTNIVQLSASATSGLPVGFSILTGPAMLTGGSNLSFFDTGAVAVLAQQPGDTNWNAAPQVTNVFNVGRALQTIAFPNPGDQFVNSAVRLVATADSGLAVSFVVRSGPATISEDVWLSVTGTGTVSIAASQAGDRLWEPAAQTNVSFLALAPESRPPAPRNVSATEGAFTNRIRILWQAVSNAAQYDVWRNTQPESASATPLAVVAANSSAAPVAMAYDDYAILPNTSYYYWVRAEVDGRWSLFSAIASGYAAGAFPSVTTLVDLAVTDFVFLPVRMTNLTHAGTVSCFVQNHGPDALSRGAVQLDFHLRASAGEEAWIGCIQTNLTLSPGQEALMVLTPAQRKDVIVPADVHGAFVPTARVRHLTEAIDPNPSNNLALAAGRVIVQAGGINSPGRTRNDFDGDGRSDVAMYSSGEGRWGILLSGARYEVCRMEESGGQNRRGIPGDYDGDSVTDLAVYEAGSGEFDDSGWWSVWPSADPSFPLSLQLGGAGYVPVPVDFDGDGLTDFVAFRALDGCWVAMGAATELQIYKMWLGGAEDAAFPADYDGDNKADPMVYDRFTGEWLGLLSGSGYRAFGGYWGGSGLVAIPADYDGDGRADPALYDSASGVWSFLLSNGATGPIGQSYLWATDVFGEAGGMPVASDFDGDGKADPAVYNPVTTIWQAFFSSQGYAMFSCAFGGPGYMPVAE